MEKRPPLSDEELESTAGGIAIGNTWPPDDNPGSIEATNAAHPPKPPANPEDSPYFIHGGTPYDPNGKPADNPYQLKDHPTWGEAGG